MEWLAELPEEAKAAALIRPDVTVLDLRVVLCGVVLQLTNVAERDSALWRRYARLTLQALRPAPRGPASSRTDERIDNSVVM
ncbi:hypothetical protein [Streptomyces sp. NPDC057428]|uniref:hypothetical protein n=1 Tax=Streptomyces sp. NPDC057428 TaxID=3346129 RepID=UPI00368535D4